MAVGEFVRRHSVTIRCPRCGRRLLVTEWTTTLDCPCRKHLDAVDILFECSTQVYSARASRRWGRVVA